MADIKPAQVDRDAAAWAAWNSHNRSELELAFTYHRIAAWNAAIEAALDVIESCGESCYQCCDALRALKQEQGE